SAQAYRHRIPPSQRLRAEPAARSIHAEAVRLAQALTPDRFDLDQDADLIRYAGQTVVHAEVAALERCGEVAAADFRLGVATVVAVEAFGIKSQGLGFAQQGKGAADGFHLVVLESEIAAF